MNSLKLFPTFGLTLLLTTTACLAADDYPIRPVPFTAVRVDDAFWTPRLETNRLITVWYDFRKCEETGRIDNFPKAGGLLPGKVTFQTKDRPELLGGMVTVKATSAARPGAPLTLIPYYAWCHRGPNEMRVWILTR